MTVEPKCILAHGWTQYGGKPTFELLIQCQHRSLEEANWEVYDLITKQFPAFHLEDKTNFQGGGTNTVPPLRTYPKRPSGKVVMSSTSLNGL